MKPYLLTAFLFIVFSNLFAQPVDDLFQQKNSLSKDYRRLASKYQALQLNNDRFSSLRQQAPADLKLELPFENRSLKLDLKKVSITSDNFSVIEARADGSRHLVSYPGAIFYQGKIEGTTKSFATISIVNDQVSGIIADDKSNIVLGAIEENGKATNEYTLYRESDLQVHNPANCFTSDEPVDGPANPNHNPSGRLTLLGEPVDIYFECDYKFYQDKGSNTINVINYVLSFFNNTSLLYANENIKIQVSQILVWTSTDPEAGIGSSTAVLTAFSTRMASTTYVGDYAHFLSTRALGGGVAFLLSNPCTSSKSNRTGVSAINNTYADFPTYSWTVEVVTHELGHNLGSHHTHWCGWVNGAIDNCGPNGGYPNEGGPCALGPTPTNGGTIMSYCHLVSAGINFNNGFGPQPGQAIRDVVTASACFGNCRLTVDVTKQDASCGQNNGSATATATNGTGNIIYLWSTGFIGSTLSNAAPGTYHVMVGDAAGCQVMQVVTIGNSGTALTFSLTPNGSAGFCSGGSVTLNATNNAAYNYVWKKDGNVIGGATTSSYIATTAGTYSVTVSSGACSSTQSVVVSVVTPPVANIAPGGVTTFCDGSNIVLNGDAGGSYTYQWYNNSVLINGATSPTYTATATGNYTVKVSAGTSCDATSTPVAVTVNPTPAANITNATVTSFCEGGSVVLTASTGTGYNYQWYKNGNSISGATQSTYTATTGGNYTVTTSIGSCSKTSAGTNVIVWTNPVVTVTPTLVTIEKYQTQVLTASGAVSYNWDIQPALINAGTNTGTFKPLTTTNYTIQGTDANGCKGTANATIVVIGCGDVTNVTATAYSPSRVIVRWTNPSGATTDTLQYRKAGTTTWTRVFVTGQEYEINGLIPGTDYEYNIIALCSTTNTFLPSASKPFTTPNLTSPVYIKLFPNPVNSASKLEIISASSFTLQIILYDNAGKKIMIVSPAESLPAGQVIKAINSSVLQSGVYHLAVNINGKTQDIMMVVAH